MSGTDERELRRTVARVREGDRSAFRDLVRRVHGRVYRWALSLVGDADLADEAAQRVLIRVYRHLSTYEASSPFLRWLYAITRNTSLTLLNEEDRNGREELREDHAAVDGADTADRIEDRRAAEAVRSFFGTLSSRQREVLDLVDLQGYTPAEAAEMLGLSGSTVRVHLHRARKALREELLDRHPDLGERYGDEL